MLLLLVGLAGRAAIGVTAEGGPDGAGEGVGGSTTILPDVLTLGPKLPGNGEGGGPVAVGVGIGVFALESEKEGGAEGVDLEPTSGV